MSDVVIAGAGLIGLTLAWELRLRGARVTLLDAGQPGREASWAGGGILWPVYPWRYPCAVQELAIAGAAAYPALCDTLQERTGIDSELRRCGVLVFDPGEHEAALAWAKANAAVAEPLDAAALAARLPGVEPATAAALWFPEVAQLRNPRLCRALVTALQDDPDASLRFGCPAQAVQRNQGRFAGFRCNGETITGAAGVIAAGAWSSAIEGADGLPRVFPVKGQMLLLRGAPGLLPHILIRGGHYAIPRADGRILVGSTVEHRGFDAAATPAVANELRAAAHSLWPPLAELPVEKHWAGLRPATDNGLPFIGPLPAVPGLYASVGHYRNGVANAPAAAARLAGQILDAGRQ